MPKIITNKQPNSHMCFVCGLKNKFGLKARFFEIEEKELVGIFDPADEHQGYPGRLHGGIASTILDETIGRAVLIEHKDSWWVTAELSVRFKKPVPIDGPIKVVGRITGSRGRIFEGTGEILLADGTAAVTATAKYFAQPIGDIVENEDFADEMWEVVPESTDPLSIEI
ncbi:MAG: PaaI family thioesterase [Spirochaetes bacterium]|nr:MAG: PaaI family thioesterase [Spirochaetota bacterium]